MGEVEALSAASAGQLPICAGWLVGLNRLVANTLLAVFF
jgi:hypothetical protein